MQKKIIKSNLVVSELSGSSSSIAIIFELGFRNEKFGTWTEDLDVFGPWVDFDEFGPWSEDLGLEMSDSLVVRETLPVWKICEEDIFF